MSGRVPQKHRAAALACSNDRPPGTCETSMIPDAGSSCHKDAECGAGANGRCSPMQRIYACGCTYDTCTTDADCAKAGMGGPCECRPAAQSIIAPTPTTTNICKGGTCRVDADCGSVGGYCSPSLGSCGNYGGIVGYYCHSARDKCIDDADCATQGGGDCRYDPSTGAWACATSQCAG